MRGYEDCGVAFAAVGEDVVAVGCYLLELDGVVVGAEVGG